jgi:hypothetical protein
VRLTESIEGEHVAVDSENHPEMRISELFRLFEESCTRHSNSTESKFSRNVVYHDTEWQVPRFGSPKRKGSKDIRGIRGNTVNIYSTMRLDQSAENRPRIASGI